MKNNMNINRLFVEFAEEIIPLAREEKDIILFEQFNKIVEKYSKITLNKIIEYKRYKCACGCGMNVDLPESEQ